MLFQLDGAPPHWGLQVRAFLNDKFLERWGLVEMDQQPGLRDHQTLILLTFSCGDM